MASPSLEWLNQLRTTVLVNHHPQQALQQIQSQGVKTQWMRFTNPFDSQAVSARILGELTAYSHMDAGDYQAASRQFECLNDPYQAGLCMVLAGNLDEAQHLWRPYLCNPLDIFSGRGAANGIHPFHWAQTLWGLLTLDVQTYPTYLQVRNHLEVDCHLLLKAGQAKLVDNIVAQADVLATVNAETFKYLGRTMLIHGQLQQADALLTRGEQFLPSDPEVFFHHAQVYLAVQQPKLAIERLHQSLHISPYYAPARAALEDLKAL